MKKHIVKKTLSLMLAFFILLSTYPVAKGTIANAGYVIDPPEFRLQSDKSGNNTAPEYFVLSLNKPTKIEVSNSGLYVDKSIKANSKSIKIKRVNKGDVWNVTPTKVGVYKLSARYRLDRKTKSFATKLYVVDTSAKISKTVVLDDANVKVTANRLYSYRPNIDNKEDDYRMLYMYSQIPCIEYTVTNKSDKTLELIPYVRINGFDTAYNLSDFGRGGIMVAPGKTVTKGISLINVRGASPDSTYFQIGDFRAPGEISVSFRVLSYDYYLMVDGMEGKQPSSTIIALQKSGSNYTGYPYVYYNTEEKKIKTDRYKKMNSKSPKGGTTVLNEKGIKIRYLKTISGTDDSMNKESRYKGYLFFVENNSKNGVLLSVKDDAVNINGSLHSYAKTEEQLKYFNGAKYLKLLRMYYPASGKGYATVWIPDSEKVDVKGNISMNFNMAYYNTAHDPETASTELWWPFGSDGHSGIVDPTPTGTDSKKISFTAK